MESHAIDANAHPCAVASNPASMPDLAGSRQSSKNIYASPKSRDMYKYNQIYMEVYDFDTLRSKGNINISSFFV